MVDQSQSIPAAGQTGGANAAWRTTFVSKAWWCRLRREDLVRIRAEQVKFIAQSSAPEDARIEWYLTWPRKSVHAPEGARRRARRSARLAQSRLELRAVETADELWKASGVPGLDAMVSRITDYGGRRPRVFRHLEVSAIAPGYRASLRIGGLSRMSPRTTIICEAPGTEIPEFVRSVYEIIARRTLSLTLVVGLSAWSLASMVTLALPAVSVPVFYTNFQHASNRDNVTAAAFWSTIGYLIAVTIMVSISFYLSAARAVLPRVERFGTMKSALSRAAQHLVWSDRTTVGPVRRHIALAGGGLASAGLTAILAYVIATTSTNTRNAPAWPYWLFGALIAVGFFFYLMGVMHFRRKPQSGGTDTTDSSKANL